MQINCWLPKEVPNSFARYFLRSFITRHNIALPKKLLAEIVWNQKNSDNESELNGYQGDDTISESRSGQHDGDNRIAIIEGFIEGLRRQFDVISRKMLCTSVNESPTSCVLAFEGYHLNQNEPRSRSSTPVGELCNFQIFSPTEILTGKDDRISIASMDSGTTSIETFRTTSRDTCSVTCLKSNTQLMSANQTPRMVEIGTALSQSIESNLSTRSFTLQFDRNFTLQFDRNTLLPQYDQDESSDDAKLLQFAESMCQDNLIDGLSLTHDIRVAMSQRCPLEQPSQYDDCLILHAPSGTTSEISRGGSTLLENRHDALTGIVSNMLFESTVIQNSAIDEPVHLTDVLKSGSQVPTRILFRSIPSPSFVREAPNSSSIQYPAGVNAFLNNVDSCCIGILPTDVTSFSDFEILFAPNSPTDNSVTSPIPKQRIDLLHWDDRSKTQAVTFFYVSVHSPFVQTASSHDNINISKYSCLSDSKSIWKAH